MCYKHKDSTKPLEETPSSHVTSLEHLAEKENKLIMKGYQCLQQMLNTSSRMGEFLDLSVVLPLL